MKTAERMDLLGSETAFAVSAEATNLALKGTKINENDFLKKIDK